MIYWTSGSAVLEATLTEKGKEIMAIDPTKFKITKFSLSDDEVDYSLSEASITALNIMPPIKYPTSLRYSLITLPKGTLTLATIAPIGNVNISGTGVSNPIVISTLNGLDITNGYTVKCNTNGIVLQSIVDKFNATAYKGIRLDKNTKMALAFDDGTITNQVLTVENTFLIKSRNIAGTYTIDIVGNNSGASLSITTTVTYVDYTQYTSQTTNIADI